MLHMPSRSVTPDASRNLERFRQTPFAQELDRDSRRWDVVEWSWESEPPLRIQLRSDQGEVLEFLMDEPGFWRVHPDPNVPFEPVPGEKSDRS